MSDITMAILASIGLGMPGMLPRRQTPWSGDFKTYSPGFAARPRAVEEGDKGVFPDSVLAATGGALGTSTCGEPGSVLIFRVTNPRNGATAFCSVLEFSTTSASGDAAVFLPWWLLQNLQAEEGEQLHYEEVQLPKGTSVKLMPTSPAFYDVANPRAVLEAILSRFTVLSKGMTFTVKAPSGDEQLSFTVVEVAPGDAVCIVDTDINVDFAPMPGMETAPATAAKKLATDTPPPAATTTSAPNPGEFAAFSGEGHKQKPLSASADDTQVCGNCGARVATATFELHKLRCERLNIRCALCGKVVQRSEEERHMQAEHALIECPKCGVQVERSKLAAHEKDDCPMGTAPCQYCDVAVKRAELAAHTEYCGSRSEKCPECGKFFPKRAMLQHATVCTGHEVQAPFRPSLPGESVGFCPTCMETFTDLSLLQTHAATCTGPDTPPHAQPRRPFPEPEDELLLCYKCQTTEVRGYDALNRHLEMCRGPPPRRPTPEPYTRPPPLFAPTTQLGPFRCPLCSQTFLDAASVTTHVNVEH